MAETSLIITLATVVVAGIFASRIAEYYSFPKPIILILAGIIMGILGSLDTSHTFDLTLIRENTLFVVELALIAVLFQEGMHFNLSAIRKHFITIILIATIGTILTTVLVGSLLILLFPFLQITLVVALLIGGVFTPSDPATTFSVLRGGTTRVKEKFETILGGEAALNDVVSIILVVVILIPAVAGQSAGMEISLSFDIIVNALWQLIGGSLIGIIMGIFALLLIAFFPSRIEESLLSLCAVLLVFAFSVLTGTNAAIGALIAGIVLNNPQFFKLKPDLVKQQIHDFWGYIVFILEILAFMFVGTIFSIPILINNPIIILFAALVSVTVILGRMIGIFVITFPLELFHSLKEEFNTRERLFIGFAGMKGLTTAVLASLTFIELEGISSIAVVIFYSSVLVIIFTGVFQAALLKVVASKTGVLQGFQQDDMDDINAHRVILTSTLSLIEEEIQSNQFRIMDFKKLSLPLREELYMIREHLELINRHQQHDIPYLEFSLKINLQVRHDLLQAKESGEIKETTYQRILVQLLGEEEELLRFIETSNMPDHMVPTEDTSFIQEELSILESEIELLESKITPKTMAAELIRIKDKLLNLRSQYRRSKSKKPKSNELS